MNSSLSGLAGHSRRWDCAAELRRSHYTPPGHTLAPVLNLACLHPSLYHLMNIITVHLGKYLLICVYVNQQLFELYFLPAKLFKAPRVGVSNYYVHVLAMYVWKVNFVNTENDVRMYVCIRYKKIRISVCFCAPTGLIDLTRDCNCDRLWVRLPFEKIKYLIFSFLCHVVEVKCIV